MTHTNDYVPLPDGAFPITQQHDIDMLMLSAIQRGDYLIESDYVWTEICRLRERIAELGGYSD
jgi:hypothetical protein